MASSKHKLLYGPYKLPAVRRGGRTVCLYRDTKVIITSWTDARILWPRCQTIGVRGGSGLLVDEELLRAIRTESSLAIQCWWGVQQVTVWRWRRAFGIAQWGTEGSRQLHQLLSEKGGAKLRGKKLPKALVQRRLKIRGEHGFKMPRRWAKTGWKQWQLDLLGTAPDAELAARFGRTVTAVLVMRNRLGRALGFLARAAGFGAALWRRTFR